MILLLIIVICYLTIGFSIWLVGLDPSVSMNKVGTLPILLLLWLYILIKQPEWWVSLYNDKFDNNWFVKTFLRSQ